MKAALTPEPVEAVAEPHGRLPFAFAPRFYIALVVGLLWLVPAWWSPRFISLLFTWDALVLAGWLFDLRRLPPPRLISGSRSWNEALNLARPSTLHIELRADTGMVVECSVVDELSPAFYAEVPQWSCRVTREAPCRNSASITPQVRGSLPVGSVYLRYRSMFGLAERWACLPLTQTVVVLPDVMQANEQALYLVRSRQVELQKRRRQQPGLGREFESLRDYRAGDEFRDICWSATARRHNLVTRTFEAERSQVMWVIVDAGRLLRAEITQPDASFRLSKLDYAVNAALSLASVASQYGDRCALLAYGRTVQKTVAPGRGPEQIRRFIEALAHVHAEQSEANHALAARVLLQKQTRRALVIWITDFAETPTIPDVVEYATQLSKRHLVLFAAISQPDLALCAHQISRTETDMYEAAAALALVQRREVLLRRLRQQGVLAMELAPGKLTTTLVNQYLEIKDRSLL